MTNTASRDKSGSNAKQNSTPMIDVVVECLEDAKAEDTISIDMFGKSPMSDYMVITSGRSQRHVGAIANQLSKAIKEAGFKSPRIEGMPNCDWVLVDAGDVIIHIFRPEVRQFYNLEKMWQGDLAQGDLAQGDLAQGDLAQGNLAKGNLAQDNLAQGNLANEQAE